MDAQSEHYHDGSPRFWRSRWSIGFVVMATIAMAFLWEGHRAHLLGALPYLAVLVCPLMHVFMHSAHGHAHGEGVHGPPDGSPDRGEE